MTEENDVKLSRLHALPRTYSDQHFTSTSPVPRPHTSLAITEMDHSLRTNMGELCVSNTSALKFTRRIIHSATSLERIGLRRFRALVVLQTDNTNTEARNQSDHSDVVHEERIYSLEINRLGFGIRLSRIHPYGSILPALTTYPIIKETFEIYELFWLGTMSEIQQAFRSGDLHPFAQDRDGYTLLHVCLRSYLEIVEV
jgi:hypothetical protein